MTSTSPAAALRGLFESLDAVARMGNRSLSEDDLDAELSRLTGGGAEWLAERGGAEWLAERGGAEWLAERGRAAGSADSGELTASILMVRAVASNLLLQKLENDTVYNRWDETGARAAGWLRRHQEIPGADKLLHKLTKSLDDGRYKLGHIYHALLVERFHEDGTFEVTEVEPDFGPKIDVDFVLNGDIHVQVWTGKPAADHTADETRGLGFARSGGIVPDQAEYFRIAKKKMSRLPKAGKRFLLNVLPGHAMRHYSQVHSIYDAYSCFIEMTVPYTDYATASHATVYGSGDFRHRDLVCRMIHAIDPRRAANFVLGEWRGADKRYEAHGIDFTSPRVRDFYSRSMLDADSQRGAMLEYAERWYPDKVRFLRKLATESMFQVLTESLYHEGNDCRCGKYAGRDQVQPAE